MCINLPLNRCLKKIRIAPKLINIHLIHDKWNFSHVSYTYTKLKFSLSFLHYKSLTHLLWIFVSKRTETQQVPDPWLWYRFKHHVHHPEGVNHFHSHPAENAEECVVQQAAHEATHTLGRDVCHGAGEDEEHEKEEQSDNQTTVHQTRKIL